MADNSSRSSNRKLGLVAPISIAAAIALVVLVAWLVTTFRPEPAPVVAAPAPAPEPAPAPVAALPADPVLGRSDLIAATNALASAYAADGAAAMAGGKDPLAGRRFAVRIPFGCEGPQVRAGASQAYYEFDAAKRTVRLVARPATWTGLPVIQETTRRDRVEGAEGFWIPQPWSALERCPPPRDKPLPAAPTPSAAETLGLARLFSPADTRVGRRGERPYEHVLKLDDGDAPPLFQGYKLVLEGRFSTYPDGRAAHCWSESPAHRPVCLYAVDLERVAFEAGDTGRLLAEWRDG